MNAWFSSEFNRLNTWYPQMDLFTSYLKRVNYMLQQGLNIADVAYFIGEDAPKMTGIVDLNCRKATSSIYQCRGDRARPLCKGRFTDVASRHSIPDTGTSEA